MTRRSLLGAGLSAVPGLVALPAFGQAPAPNGQPVIITVTTAAPAPDVSLVLGKRDAKVVPVRCGCQHTGGGNIDVQQPTPDVIVVTMSGVAVAHGSPAGPATAALDFALNQEFEVSFDNPKVKTAKLCMEGRVVGFLRSHKVGSAEESGSAAITGGAGPILTVDVLSHSVAGGQSLGVNDKVGPCCQVVPAGKFCLTQTFRVAATMPRVILPCKSPSAEFAPDPALNPLWISAKEPFQGAKKADLGYQIIVSVRPDVVAK
jgi:hypothetical protein